MRCRSVIALGNCSICLDACLNADIYHPPPEAETSSFNLALPAINRRNGESPGARLTETPPAVFAPR